MHIVRLETKDVLYAVYVRVAVWGVVPISWIYIVRKSKNRTGKIV